MPHPEPGLSRLRANPMAFLPGLIALALASTTLPARAETRLMALCNGGALPIPGQMPDGGCDTACHIGCQRPKKPSGRL
ncbi:MAG: hypothetical protein MUE77_04245 [Sandarakinorhabdus sp.]|jgi:hypothetical protein|nr:hypothetical protein [Sandarakinorhabdus sp.]